MPYKQTDLFEYNELSVCLYDWRKNNQILEALMHCNRRIRLMLCIDFHKKSLLITFILISIIVDKAAF